MFPRAWRAHFLAGKIGSLASIHANASAVAPLNRACRNALFEPASGPPSCSAFLVNVDAGSPRRGHRAGNTLKR
jgi:hypothetical protein